MTDEIEKTPAPVVVEVTKFRKHEGWVGYTFTTQKHQNLQNSGKTWKEAEESLYRSLTFLYGKLGFSVMVVNPEVK